MKPLSINRAMILITACSLGLLSVFASAGQDESQRYQIQQAITAKQQAQAAVTTMMAACQKMMEPSKDSNSSK
jgi:hypothetical protein